MHCDLIGGAGIAEIGCAENAFEKAEQFFAGRIIAAGSHGEMEPFAAQFHGVIQMNNTAALIVDCLKQETTEEQIKAAMAMKGLIAEEYRLPLCELAPASREKLAKTLKRCGIL